MDRKDQKWMELAQDRVEWHTISPMRQFGSVGMPMPPGGRS